MAWTLPLPLGARFSIDALRAQRLPDIAPVYSLAAPALLMQVVAIYLLNALAKNGHTWHDGTVVYYVLHQERLVTPAGVFLREHAPRQAGGADLASLQRGDQAQQFLMLGDFGKHALLHFERGVPAVKLREAYRQSLVDDTGPNATPELRRDTEAFLTLFDRDLSAGDDVNIHTDPDGQVFVRIGSGHTRSGPTNPRLAHDIWAAWLGRDPISTDLKRQLIGRIDVLGR